MKGNFMKERTHDEAMAEAFCKDPAYAVELLNSILEDGDQGELLIVLRQMAKAFGGVSRVAEKAQLNGTQIYRTLSAAGNPEVRSLIAILKSMGLRLAVQQIQSTYVLEEGKSDAEQAGNQQHDNAGGNRQGKILHVPTPV